MEFIMKKQLFLTAALMSVTAFSAQASDFGQATADYTREIGQATVGYTRELGQATVGYATTSAELAKNALFEAIGNSLPYAVTEPIFSRGLCAGYQGGFSMGFYAGQEAAYRGILSDLKYVGKLAAAGIATYYVVKYAKACIQDALPLKLNGDFPTSKLLIARSL